jgi:hypothetical protein
MAENLKTKASPPRTSDPAVGIVAITGANQTLAYTSRGVYVAPAGTLQCTFEDGSTGTLAGLAAGQVYPFAITAITGAGTSITGHVLL